MVSSPANYGLGSAGPGLRCWQPRVPGRAAGCLKMCGGRGGKLEVYPSQPVAVRGARCAWRGRSVPDCNYFGVLLAVFVSLRVKHSTEN